MAKVLVADDLSAEGVELLRRGGVEVDVKVGLKPDELKAIIGQYDGLAVRSATKVTAEILEHGKKLKVVGRAGVGVDNVDLPAATKRGVVVMNTPGGSSITVAELTLAMMLSMFRHVPAATASVKAGKWEKKKFQGRELMGKTLGVIGIGNIGGIVVDRARAFGMKVIAYDPFIAPEAAARLGAELVTLDELFPRADVISLHVPLTEQTRHLINEKTLGKMKKGVYLVNAARGGIVDEPALAAALKSGQVAAAAFDVFEKEPVPADNPLLQLENFVCAPHIGASTEEAQEAVAVQLAEQMAAFFAAGEIKNAVNVPSVSKEVLAALGPWLHLSNKLGALAGQLAPQSTTKVTIEYAGDVTRETLKPLTAQVLKGLLTHFTQDPVNEVNAPEVAKDRGLQIQEIRTAASSDYASTVSVKLEGQGTLEVQGTVFGKRDLRVVRVDQFEIDAVPEGTLLVVRNEDVPKIVGKVGTILGDAGVNIGRIHLSRSGERGQAFSMINIDSPAPAAVLEQLRQIPHVVSVTAIQL